MSNAELLVKSDSELTDQEFKVSEKVEIEIDNRSQEMLLVLNEVFDSIIPSSQS
ncbi:hypothetical protein [Gimesia fumaroli]|jgi:hypothetical protein|uniref:Uncharacterized protein n=1 Tax=Gimesia fumaroli TaxID=2527976 RepID=A0A518IBU1_9PLAN|nr:hypothetical protein [Gimesia fumaroli]QDV50568.1 hypothetical protein Enr17x_26090 [Gimesia fumaroli]